MAYITEGQDSETPFGEVQWTIIIYGSCSRDPEDYDERFPDGKGMDQRRAELQLRPVIPAEHMGSVAARTKYMQQFSHEIHSDVKHSRNWRCEFCKKFARETLWSMASWLHLNPPRMTTYIHNLCSTNPGPCAEAFADTDAQMAAIGGPSHVPWKPQGYHSDVFPMSATCAVCKDESLSKRKSVKQCARCKFTRYCSVACQKEHWPTHKVFCKVVQDVKWVWH
ncbi:hypothetical protein EXIGLDRAFT_725451 [Exidia glandulosa HHB12029]|uniref:MYND-type domain-containing protein n=1 Tax=Exidia glandulosa HHB12029 TaxID=1314781 RepID=A0A165E1T4_EXIGL|nr:hypothetical protein EXIGLDRAFT_725451 [Exidia glandulosa HHB12029]